MINSFWRIFQLGHTMNFIHDEVFYCMKTMSDWVICQWTKLLNGAFFIFKCTWWWDLRSFCGWIIFEYSQLVQAFIYSIYVWYPFIVQFVQCTIETRHCLVDSNKKTILMGLVRMNGSHRIAEIWVGNRNRLRKCHLNYLICINMYIIDYCNCEFIFVC